MATALMNVSRKYCSFEELKIIGDVNREKIEKMKLSTKKGTMEDYCLLVRYSCIAFAARLPAPIALMTVAAPVATSPPA